MTDVSSAIANEPTRLEQPRENAAASASRMSAEAKLRAGEWLSPEELAELPAFANGTPQHKVVPPEDVEEAPPAEEQLDEPTIPTELEQNDARICQLEVHRYARLFPLMEGEEFEALVADIKANGLREPITLDAHDRIVDGRNRARACEAAGVSPRYASLNPAIADDEDVLDWIVGRNMLRRHLTTSQRAAIAAEIASLKSGRPRKSAKLHGLASQSAAAKAMKVSTRSVAGAAAVKRASPELHAAMKAGRISTNAALKQIPKPEPTPTRLNEADLFGAANALFEFDLWCRKYRSVIAETSGLQAHADAILKALRALAA